MDLWAPLRAQDFVVRYSAFKLFSQGQNPYDLSLLRPLEQQIAGWDVNIPFLNPPWTLLLLSPLMPFSYEWSALLMAMTNVLLAIIAASLAFRACSGGSPPLRELLPALFFVPGIFCLIWGQLGFFLGLGISFVLLGERRNSVLMTLAGVLLLSVKPHLFFLLIVAGGWAAWKKRNFRLPLFAALAFAFLLLACEAISPGITGNWLHASRGGFQDLQRLRSCNVPAILSLLLSNGGALPLLPLIVLPVATAALLLVWLEKAGTPVQWQLVLPVLLPLSLLMTPYAWHHDFAVILPIQALLLCRLKSASLVRLRAPLRIGLAAMHAAVGVQMYFAFRYAAEFTWIPLFFLILGAVVWHSERRTEEFDPGKL